VSASGVPARSPKLLDLAQGTRVAFVVPDRVNVHGSVTTVFVNVGDDSIAECVNDALSVNCIQGVGDGQPAHPARANATSPGQGGQAPWYTKPPRRRHRRDGRAEGHQGALPLHPFGERTILSPSWSALSASAIGNQMGFTGRYHNARPA
jgi:hypothetical protein